MKNKSIYDSIKRIKNLVDKQAEDEGLWYNARYITEDYLQRELRKLHKIIEDEFENIK